MKKKRSITIFLLIFTLILSIFTCRYFRQKNKIFNDETFILNKNVYENGEKVEITYKIINDSIFKYKAIKEYQNIVDFKIFEKDPITNQIKVIHLAESAVYGFNEITIKPYDEFENTYAFNLDISKEYSIHGVCSLNFKVDYFPKDYGYNYVRMCQIINGIVCEGTGVGII